MHTTEKLELLLARLRDSESGCRWDLQQDWSSLVKYTREEVEELAEAVEPIETAVGEADALTRELRATRVQEELGDLLFHIAFYSRIAQEQGLFSLSDVVDGLCQKMLERHPHVFPDAQLDGERVATGNQPSLQELNESWKRIKKQQKNK